MRLVQRARIIVAMLDEPELPASDAAVRAGLSCSVGPTWVRRFDEAGVSGLADKPRPGRPPDHPEAVRSQLIDLALQKPESLGYAFKQWTITRLQETFRERTGQHLSRSTIWEWLEAEGLKWKRQQSWFHEPEQHDPEFVEKREPSFGHT